MTKPKLSIVIPCYNEEKNLRRGALAEVSAFLKEQPYSAEVIIVNDGSTDASLAMITKFCSRNRTFRFLDNSHGGKAFAIKSGVEKAKGEIVLFADLDQSTPIAEYQKFEPYFKQGFDIVIGSRGQNRKGFSLIRRLASAIFRLLREIILLPNIADTQCGFKAFKNNIAKDLFSRLLIFRKAKETKGWRVGAFDVELLFIAQKLGLKIAEIKVSWEDRDVSSGKQRKFVQESKEMLKQIIRVKLNDLKGLYK